MSVVGKIVGNEVIQILAALLALLSGILSLVSNVNYTVEDTSNIFEASSKYYSLSSRVHTVLLKPNLKADELFENLKLLLGDYSALNEAYSKYDLFRLVSRSAQMSGSATKSHLSGLKQYGYSSLNAFDIYTTTTDGQVPKRFSKYKNVTKAVRTELENLDNELDRISEM